ncbi:MAG: hypothetical protein MZW92_74720 [Comamonadaceae bacterium]|nr:hypothetical protein [Comamonadaceae bacterium]
MWDKLQRLLPRGARRRGCSTSTPATPSSLTSHGPGYIDREQRGDRRPADRRSRSSARSCPTAAGGMVESGLKAYGCEPDPDGARDLHQVPQDPQRRRLRRLHRRRSASAGSSSIITGLPDAYGRGRIIGDYRRVALYGVDRLIEAQAGGDAPSSTRAGPREDVIRAARGTGRADPRARRAEGDGGVATASTSAARPANAREAVQWTYFGYLGAVKEQNGAAMSLGRVSTFLDIYIERDLDARAARPRQRGAGAHRRLRDQAAHRPLPAHARSTTRCSRAIPTWVDRVPSAAWRDDGRTLVTKTSFRMLQTLNNLGPGARAEPDGALVDAPAGGLQALLRRRPRSTPARCSTRTTT